jgi:hypothetical protein
MKRFASVLFNLGDRSVMLACLLILLTLMLLSCTVQPVPSHTAQVSPVQTSTALPTIVLKPVTITPSPTNSPTVIPTPTHTLIPTPTQTPSPTPIAGGGFITYWDYWDEPAGFYSISPDGSEPKRIFALNELPGRHRKMDRPPGFSPGGHSYLFITFDDSKGVLHLVVFDAQIYQSNIVQSFPIEASILPINVIWVNQNTIIYDMVHSDPDQPSQIHILDIQETTPHVIPFTAYSHRLEAVLSDGSLITSSKSESTDIAYTRQIISIDGKIVTRLDIDGQIADIIGRSVTGELLLEDINSKNDYLNQPQISGTDMYMKKCSKSPAFFTCYILKLDLDSYIVTKVFEFPGESIASIGISPDNTIMHGNQCSYINSIGSVNNCKLKAYDMKTADILFEIRNAGKPVWSPDSQYFIYLNRVVENLYLKSSSLMMSDRNGKERILLVPETDRVGDPGWFIKP